MKTMFIDCSMGAAGDMLTAALLELLDEAARNEFVSEFNSLGIPGVNMSVESSEKCGVLGTHVNITVNGTVEDEHVHDHHEHRHSHEHSHDEGTTHTHNSMTGIRHIVMDHMVLPEKVKNSILKVYSIIAEAESTVHGVPLTDIHFHEVGSMDALADVTAVCMLMNRISPDKVVASPVNTGSGWVKCAHGILPVPAPATANILIGVPAYSNGIQSELLTPTGAALLKFFAGDFGQMPLMKLEKVGYGMGTKDFDIANCIRIIIGETL